MTSAVASSCSGRRRTAAGAAVPLHARRQAVAGEPALGRDPPAAGAHGNGRGLGVGGAGDRAPPRGGPGRRRTSRSRRASLRRAAVSGSTPDRSARGSARRNSTRPRPRLGQSSAPTDERQPGRGVHLDDVRRGAPGVRRARDAPARRRTAAPGSPRTGRDAPGRASAASSAPPRRSTPDPAARRRPSARRARPTSACVSSSVVTALLAATRAERTVADTRGSDHPAKLRPSATEESNRAGRSRSIRPGNKCRAARHVVPTVPQSPVPPSSCYTAVPRIRR